MHTCTALGLVIRSELPLPSLRPSPDATPDLDILLGPVAPEGLADAVPMGCCAQSLPGQAWLHVPGVARFLVASGNSITVNPETGADDQSVRLFLLGSCIGAVMHRRGRLILHGSALRFGDRCAVFAGVSGAGKSTLTAALHLRGRDPLADDLSVVDLQGRIQPGIPHIKLWAGTAAMLGLQARHLQLCGQLADRIRMIRVTLPQSGSSLDELAERVEADMQADERAEAPAALETA